LVILWKRDKRETKDIKAHSEMVCNKTVGSLRGRVKGVEGWKGGGLGGKEQVRYEFITHLFLSPRGLL
jgi:hypothetical protein